MRILAGILVSLCICWGADDVYSQNTDIRSIIGSLEGDRLLQDELEITDDQMKELVNILKASETAKRFKELYDQLREEGKKQGLTYRQIGKRYSDECNKYYWSKIEEILIEKQVVRLKQLERRYNPLVAYECQMLIAHSEELGLTKEQQAKIRQITDSFLVEYEKEMKDLQDGIYNRLVAKLPESIREPYLDLVGGRFDFAKMERERTETVGRRIEAIIEAHKDKKNEEVPSDQKNETDKE